MSLKQVHEQAAAVPVYRPLKFRTLGGTSGSNKTWLVSFTDIMGLMLTFFVLMYAMSERTVIEHTAYVGSQDIGDQPGSYLGAPLSMGDSDVITLPRSRFDRGLDIDYLRRVIADRQTQAPELLALSARADGADVVLELPLGLVLNATNPSAIAELAGILDAIPNMTEMRVVMGGFDRTADGLQAARQTLGVLRAEGLNKSMTLGVSGVSARGGERLQFWVSPYVREQ